MHLDHLRYRRYIDAFVDGELDVHRARRRPVVRNGSVGVDEILPAGGHEIAHWWPMVLPTGGRWF